MAKDKVEVRPEVQAFLDAIAVDRKAGASREKSTKERNAATRGVFLASVAAFAAVKEWTADDVIRNYYEKAPKGQTLHNRRSEWNAIRKAAQDNASKAAALWPAQDDSDDAPKNITKQMFLDGIGIMNDQPLLTADAILSVVRTAKTKAEPNEGDLMAEMDATIMAVYTRFPATFAAFADHMNGIRMAYHAERAKGGYRTTEELVEAAKAAALTPVVTELKVAA